MSFRVRRSSLILPVNVPRFIEKAHTRGADAIVLDLEDSVPPAEKAGARQLVKEVYARNKKSITLDLKAPEAPDVILDLAEHFDVMIESFRFRYLERLGVGSDRLLGRNPKLVLARVSGFGQTGPYAKRPGFGTLVEAMSGFASRNGFEDREPVLPPLAMADMIAGLYGAMATVIAVRDVEVNEVDGKHFLSVKVTGRRRTGGGKKCVPMSPAPAQGLRAGITANRSAPL